MRVSFRNRMLATIGLACVICTTAAVFISSKKLEENGRKALVEKSSAVLSRLEVGAGYVAAMDTLKGVVAETVQKYPEGNISEEQRQKLLKSVPIYAAFSIGRTGAAEEHYEFRIASDQPRNQQNRATADEVAVIQRFRDDPKLKEWVETSADGQVIRVSRPVRISEGRGCLVCHGHPSKSPWGNGKDILGYDMEDLKDGDLRATFTIVSSLAPVHEAVKASTWNIALWGAGIMLIALILGFFVIRGPLSGIQVIASRLSRAAQDVAAMSQEIATASEELSEGATQQAAALQETSASMEEVRSMVAKNSENAERSTSDADQSHRTAENGQAVVQEMIHSIEQIDQSNTEIMNQIENSNQQISEIIKVISDIGNKTKVINDIVFQTKLLSFNASVEAARAGEHGKGFAVVAEEVGNLAQMSGNAASEITQMLDHSIQKVEGIVNDTRTRVESLVKAGRSKVEDGGQVARRCGEVLHEIVKSVESVSQRVAEISAGSQEQAKGVNEISKAVVQLDQVTQQNASASRNSANAAERLSRQADLLRSSVSSLMQTLEGEEASATAVPTVQPDLTSARLAPVVPLPRRRPERTAEVPSENDDRFEEL